MLAWRGEPADVPFILDAFEHGDSKARRTAARALLVFGPALTQHGRDRVYSLMQSIPAAATPEAIWALVEAQDPRVYDLALEAYRSGALGAVTTLDNHRAFDAALIGSLDLKRTLTFAQDQDPQMRLLAAQTCSRGAPTECVPWLLQLVRDRVPAVRAAAAPGLVKIGSDEAHQALTQALRTAQVLDREHMLIALRDEAGLAGLVAALDSVSPEPDLGGKQTERIFYIMNGRGPFRQTVLDPRGADALDDYMQHTPHPYGRIHAAVVLAQLGDMRAVPVLAAQLRVAPSNVPISGPRDLFGGHPPEEERVLAARALEQLAEVYPERLGELRRAAEDPLLKYLRDPEHGHPAALSALVKMRSPKVITQLHTWASPKMRLPKPTDDFATFAAQKWRWAADSLRALGQLRDPSSLGLLENTLNSRPKEFNLTVQSLANTPKSPLVVAMQLLKPAAIAGLAEFGGERAADALFAFADDPYENELTRIQACKGLAWAASDALLRDVLNRIRALRDGTNTLDPRLQCFLQTFATRAAPSLKLEIVALLEELSLAGDVASGFFLGQALGRMGVDESDEARLLALLRRDDRAALPAALALFAGARPEMAQVVALRMFGRSAAQKTELWSAYGDMLFDISDQDLSSGALYRWVENAFAGEYLGKFALPWPHPAIARNGSPQESSVHPMSSLSFRLAAYASGVEGNTAAIHALLAAEERGALIALRDTPGPGSHAAYRAYLQLPRSPMTDVTDH
jgi:HEAT repeat protein